MSIAMRLAPNKSIMDNNQVMDNQLRAKLARMSLFLLVPLMTSAHAHGHQLTNTDTVPASAPAAAPFHDKTSIIDTCPRRIAKKEQQQKH